MGSKPQYVVRLKDDGYYSENVRWATVPKDQATKMDHKKAVKVCNHL